MPEFFAFIDESGNHDIETEKQGASKYYVVTAVVVKEEKLADLEQAIGRIRQNRYGNGEIKSSKTDDRRRLQVIEDLLKIDFSFQAVAIDKSEVRKDSGLIYKQPFIKFVHGLLYNSLIRHFQDIEIRADQHGREEFMEKFRKYILENHIPDLFKSSTIKHVTSHESVLVQLADFLSGTIRKSYEKSTSREVIDGFIELIKARKLIIDEWPPIYAKQIDCRESQSEFDRTVYTVAMNSASRFISENQSSADEEGRLQLIVLKYLLFNAKFVENEYVSTHEILEHFGSLGYVGITEHQLKSTVISKLRDNDVVITSSNKGYKIPQSHQDFMDFVELVNGQSIPLLERLSRAKNALHIASQGGIKALDGVRHEKLKRVIEALEAQWPA